MSTWTRERPTEPGAYWAVSPQGAMAVVLVVRRKSRLLVILDDFDEGYSSTPLKDSVWDIPQWQRIEPPAPPEE